MSFDIDDIVWARQIYGNQYSGSHRATIVLVINDGQHYLVSWINMGGITVVCKFSQHYVAHVASTYYFIFSRE
eukprot:15099881-Ditylum_brightwellii.AAC.1